MIFIYQNIAAGIQFQMKHIMTAMKLSQKITLKLQKFLDQEWSGLKKSLFFLNYLPGKKNCLISINQIPILFFQNHVEMKSLNL